MSRRNLTAGLPTAAIGYSAVMTLVAWWVALAGVWVASLTSVSVPELVVAAVASGICVVVGVCAQRALPGRWTMRATWLRGLRRVPWAVVTETFLVWRAAARHVRGKPVRDHVHRVRLGEEGSASRQAVAVVLLGATPGNVVFDIDRQANEVLVHGLRP